MNKTNEEVSVLALCEAQHLALYPDRLYKFEVVWTCKECVALARQNPIFWEEQLEANKVFLDDDELDVLLTEEEQAKLAALRT